MRAFRVRAGEQFRSVRSEKPLAIAAVTRTTKTETRARLYFFLLFVRTRDRNRSPPPVGVKIAARIYIFARFPARARDRPSRWNAINQRATRSNADYVKRDYVTHTRYARCANRDIILIDDRAFRAIATLSLARRSSIYYSRRHV